MSRKNTLDVNKIVKRAKKALGFRRDSELAKALGVGPTTISSWKSRGNIDLIKLLALCEDICADWLLYGKGQMMCDDDDNDIVEKILLMLKDMDADQQRDVLKYVQKEELLKKLLDKQKVA